MPRWRCIHDTFHDLSLIRFVILSEAKDLLSRREQQVLRFAQDDKV